MSSFEAAKEGSRLVQALSFAPLNHPSLEVSPAEVHRHLEKILVSKAFRDAQRPKDFLRYVVSKLLDGQADQLKEYHIAVDVFGRKESFDPRIDPIVRVEASRLRSRLLMYQQNEAKRDRLILEIPKGCYIPIVRKWPPRKHRRVVVRRQRKREMSIAVLPFLNLGNHQDCDILIDSLLEELIGTLAATDEIHVVPRTAVLQFKGQAGDIRRIGRRLKVGVLLEGSVRKINQRFRIAVRLIDVSTGFTQALATYDKEVHEIQDNQQEISRAIVDVLRAKLLLPLPSSTEPTDGGNPNRDKPLRNLQTSKSFPVWE